MGLTVEIYRFPHGDCTNGGISTGHNRLCIVNIDGPTKPNDGAPAALLVKGNVPGSAKVIPAVEVDGAWVAYDDPNRVGPMFGGNIADSSDSRWNTAVGRITGAWGAPVHIHDRYETQAQYDALSR